MRFALGFARDSMEKNSREQRNPLAQLSWRLYLSKWSVLETMAQTTPRVRTSNRKTTTVAPKMQTAKTSKAACKMPDEQPCIQTRLRCIQHKVSEDPF